MSAVLWASVAWAAPSTLPDCAEHPSGPVVTLLSAVEGLRFDAAGRLWVADRGSLTIRDPATLAIVDVPAPGVDRWGFVGDVAVGGEGIHVDPLGIVALDGASGYLAPTFPSGSRVTARAVDPESGWRAVATDERLLVLDAQGRRLAERPIVGQVDDVGIADDRLFTVHDDRLTLWNRDGTVAREAPGRWTSADWTDEGMIGSDPTGRLQRWAGDEVVPDVCLFDACPSVPPAPLPGPADGADADAYGPTVLTWHHADPPPRRPTLVRAEGRHTIVAFLTAEGGLRVEELAVLRGGRVNRRIPVDPPALGVPRVRDGVVAVEERAWSLRSGRPTTTRPAPGSWAVQRHLAPDGRVGLRVGQHTASGFLPADLPSRLGAQERPAVVTRVDDGRLVVGGVDRRTNSAVEVWCLDPGPATTTAADGWLTTPVEPPVAPELWLESTQRSPERPDPRIGRPGPAGTSSDRLLVIRTPHPVELPEVPPGWRLRVETPLAAPAALPDEVEWVRRFATTPETLTLVGGVVVAAGWPEEASFPELGPPIPSTPAGRELWDAWKGRAARRRSPQVGPSLPVLSATPLEAAAEARRLLEQGATHPLLYRAAMVGEPLPAITWERPPADTGRLVVWVGADPGAPTWMLADRLDVPVAWLQGRTAWPRRPHPTIPWGTFARPVPIQDGTLLLVEGGIVRWAGTDREALAHRLRRPPERL